MSGLLRHLYMRCRLALLGSTTLQDSVLSMDQRESTNQPVGICMPQSKDCHSYAAHLTCIRMLPLPLAVQSVG